MDRKTGMTSTTSRSTMGSGAKREVVLRALKMKMKIGTRVLSSGAMIWKDLEEKVDTQRRGCSQELDR